MPESVIDMENTFRHALIIKMKHGLPLAYFPPMREAEIHVWSINLLSYKAVLNEFWLVLSEDEADKAKRFRQESDRERFVITRAMLRILIGSYLCQPPSEIKFSYGAYGKPRLALGSREIFFNVSHSKEKAVIAISGETSLGVDIEKINSDLNPPLLKNYVFSDRERGEYALVPEHARPLLFLNMWSCKEAYLKQRGIGLHMPMSQVETCFSLSPEPCVKEVWSVRYPGKVSLFNIDIDNDYVGFLVAGDVEKNMTIANFSCEALFNFIDPTMDVSGLSDFHRW